MQKYAGWVPHQCDCCLMLLYFTDPCSASEHFIDQFCLHYASSWQMTNMTSLTERWIWMNQQISLIYTGMTNLRTAFSPRTPLPTFRCLFPSRWEASDQGEIPLPAWTPFPWSGIMTMTLAETWRQPCHGHCTLRKKTEDKRRTSTWEEQLAYQVWWQIVCSLLVKRSKCYMCGCLPRMLMEKYFK